ncbi:hypothetical protein STXM2123_2229 [Streptomyces sp. F-3]|nr:hypothetical protein STXM2123_2229 [Streptomyces sp. F-3]
MSALAVPGSIAAARAASAMTQTLLMRNARRPLPRPLAWTSAFMFVRPPRGG